MTRAIPTAQTTTRANVAMGIRATAGGEIHATVAGEIHANAAMRIRATAAGVIPATAAGVTPATAAGATHASAGATALDPGGQSVFRMKSATWANLASRNVRMSPWTPHRSMASPMQASH